MKFEEVKKDYLLMMSELGMPDDMTGGFVDADHMEKVILNPTKSNAKAYMIKVIHHGFKYGTPVFYYEGERRADFIKCEDNPVAFYLYQKYMDSSFCWKCKGGCECGKYVQPEV